MTLIETLSFPASLTLTLRTHDGALWLDVPGFPSRCLVTTEGALGCALTIPLATVTRVRIVYLNGGAVWLCVLHRPAPLDGRSSDTLYTKRTDTHLCDVPVETTPFEVLIEPTAEPDHA